LATTTHTDIRTTGWIAHLPPRLRPYALLARLDRPVGTWLLLLPGLWGLELPTGADQPTRLKFAFWFAIGSLAMRSAGCVINDYWDRDIDRQVARTAGRPLASGALTPKDALRFLAFWLTLALIALLQLRPACWALAPLGLVLTALYPLAKRITWWPQLVMGFTFGFGAPMGVVAATTGPITPILPQLALLYAGVILWQLGFDTIYGFQDMEDDARIGVKSTSRLMATRARPFIATCYLLTVLCLCTAAWAARTGPGFWPLALVGGLMLLRQILVLNPLDPPGCLRLFRANVPIGWVWAAAFLCGQFTR